MDNIKNKTTNKNAIIILLTIVIAFTLGVITDFIFGPIIKINYLSEVQTIEKKIKKNNSIEENSEHFLALLDVAYIKANDFDYMVDAFYNELVYIEVEFNSFNYKEYAESNALKGFLKDLEDNILILKHDVLSGYIVTPDLNYLLSHYGEMVNTELNDYLAFRTYELNNHIYNENIQSIDISEVVKRIDLLTNKMKKNNQFFDIFEQLQNYYYDVFEGRTHGFFYNYDKNELTDYANKQYKLYSLRTDKVGDIAKDIIKNGPIQKKQEESDDIIINY